MFFSEDPLKDGARACGIAAAVDIVAGAAALIARAYYTGPSPEGVRRGFLIAGIFLLCEAGLLLKLGHNLLHKQSKNSALAAALVFTATTLIGLETWLAACAIGLFLRGAAAAYLWRAFYTLVRLAEADALTVERTEEVERQKREAEEKRRTFGG